MVARSVIIDIKWKDGRLRPGPAFYFSTFRPCYRFQHQFQVGVILIAPACVKTNQTGCFVF